jgi:hypothetical protein
MSEYWKSTPKYWCKHCSVYVRDTKLERANHESTAKHQSAIKRSLRELHRSAEQQEREKERAKREVERLNGVVSGSSSSSNAQGPGRSGLKQGGGGAYGASSQQVTQAERQKQLEQLAELGVNIPTELRGSMAMAGEWTVASTRVIEDDQHKVESGEVVSPEGRVIGVKRERERTEEEKEQEEAIKGLFRKRRKWGVDSKTMPGEGDAELDALLSMPLVKTEKEQSETPHIKKEESMEEAPGDDAPKSSKQESTPPIKEEAQEDGGVGAVPTNGRTADPATATGETGEAGGVAVMFKKRRPKNALRQK